MFAIPLPKAQHSVLHMQQQQLKVQTGIKELVYNKFVSDQVNLGWLSQGYSPLGP